MFDFSNSISHLDPKKQELLRLMLKEEGVNLAHTSIASQPRTSLVFPASYSQQRIWLLDQIDMGSGAYNVLTVVRLIGKLEKQVLERSLSEIVKRHEILRTTFQVVDDQLKQVIGPAWRVTLPQFDLSGYPPDEREAQVQKHIREEARRSFDLANGPLLRARVVRLERNEHLVLLTMHHIISDRWSWGVLLHDLQLSYTAFLQGSSPDFPPLPIQYADYTVWQQSLLESPAMEEQLAYWKVQLADTPALTALPVDHPRPTQRSGRGALLPFSIPAHLTTLLRDLCRREEVTPFMTLLAAFKTLLFRYTNQSDLAIGSPVANRMRSELEPLIGCFINTIVLRTDLAHANNFHDVLQAVRKVTTDAYAHQDIPFDKLVEVLKPERHTSYTPLFQVVFAFQNTPMPSLSLPQLSLSPEVADTGLVPYDLILTIEDLGQMLTGSLEYNTDIFEPQTIQWLLENFQVLLQAAITDPHQSLATLPIMAPSQWQKSIVEWNTTSQDRTGIPQTIHQLFEWQVQRTPDRQAVLCGNEALTYRELNHLANRLAHQLREAGVGPESLVVIAMERSLELLIAVLGVLKAGGTYVPLDPTHPAERIARIVHDVHPRLMLAPAQLITWLADSYPDLPILEQEQVRTMLLPAKTTLNDGNLSSLVQGDHLAYMIYTSGSTGLPKGVQIPHKAVVNFLLAMQREPGLSPDDTLVAITTLAFDIAALELFLPLVVGARLVIAEQECQSDMLALQKLLAATGATVMQATPVTWRLLLAAGWQGNAQLKALCGGEALPLDLAQQLRSRVGTLWNMYGPTETTIWSAVTAIGHDPQAIALGRPIDATQIYLLDNLLQPVPVGVTGELYIGGDGLSRGYFGRPDLTAERFLPDPFAQQPGKLFYRTGDLARFHADGSIEFLGRADHQVKIRGYRIELGEIETLLLQHPAIQDAVVVAREDIPSEKHLVAYIVPKVRSFSEGMSDLVSASQQAEQWETIWDRVYHDGFDQGRDRALNVGWTSSYSGSALTLEEMQEWVGRTVERILALRPERVLEIGCGTGVLLERIAPTCEVYYGTDFSHVGLNTLQAHLAQLPLDPTRVTLLEQPADELAGLPTSYFDTIIVNSVAQYFPDIDYLVHVVEGALTVLGEGGCIFIGDVRSLPLLATFHTSVQVYQAEDDLTREQVQQRIQRQLAQEQELVIAPAFFQALKERFPQISRVDIMLKRGIHKNEMNLFRYDVIIHTGKVADSAPINIDLDWPEHNLAISGIIQLLKERHPAVFCLRRIGNARLQREKQAMNWLRSSGGPTTVGAWRQISLQQTSEPGLEPEDLWALEDVLPYRVVLTWQGNTQDGSFTALFIHHSACQGNERTLPGSTAMPHLAATALAPWYEYANQPLQGKLRREIVPQVREHLQRYLPNYMLPSAIVALERFPTTTSGKVDRRALPVPDLERLDIATSFVAPRTANERALTEIWQQVLGVEHVGIHDNFFALGGDSIFAIQVVSRARPRGLAFSLQQVFLHATIADLTTQLDRGIPVGQPGSRVFAGVPARTFSNASAAELAVDIPGAEVTYPLTPMQQGMFFHHLYAPGAGEYVELMSCTLPEPLQLDLFLQAWRDVIRAYPALRTSYHWHESDQPVQAVYQNAELPLTLYDYRDLSPEEQQNNLEEHILNERQGRTFDFTTPPLMHLLLFQLGEQRYHLLWSIQHLPLDGWSLPLVLREVQASYQALLQGEIVKRQSCSLTREHLAWFQQRNLDAAESFWREELRGFITPTLQRIKRAHIQHQEAQTYAEQELTFSAVTTARLVDIARSHNLTLNTLLLGALALLLGYYSGEKDVVFGTVVSGRSADLDGIESAIGNFLNTLPVRVRISHGTPLLTWLRALQEHQALVRQYEYCPLVQVQQWSDLPAGQPLFECVFVLDHYAQQEIRQEQANTPSWHYRMQTFLKTGYALHVWAIPGQELFVRFTHRLDQLDSGTVKSLRESLEALLEGIAARPDAQLGTLPFMPEQTRQRCVSALNGSQRAYPPVTCIQELLNEQVRSTPRSTAVVFGSETLTYEDLDRKANQLARHLQALGVKPGVMVGMFVERSLEAIIAFIAILKAGGAFLPLDSSYPLSRLLHMLEDSDTKFLLFHRATADLVVRVVQEQPTWFEALLSLDETRLVAPLPCPCETIRETATYPLDACVALNRSEDIAYVMYTSGSTGLPKGVPISHRNMVSFFQWTVDYFAFRPEDRIIQYHSLSFDFSTWEIFEALLSGASLHLVPSAAARDIGSLVQYLEMKRITVLNMTPSQFATLVHYAELNRKDALASLRILVLGGEALTTTLARAARSLLPVDCQIFNEYGPTETTISCSLFPVTEAALRQYGDLASMPIGRAIANMGVYVLDGALNPVPVGVVGEIFIGGIGVGNGYFNRPDLTAERFLPDPLSRIAGARLYRTGDLAHILADGNIEFLQRKDYQVKLRGYRIELGEIEAVLLQHPSIQESVVVVYEAEIGDKVLVAYIASRAGVSSLSPSVLRAYLEQHLPDYMIPTVFMFLERLPLTPNGKVDRQALPAPERTREHLETDYIPPATAIEQEIARIWSDILEVERVGSQDNFFELGGHSLLATQVHARLRRVLQVDLPLRTLFEAVTVSDLATRVQQARQHLSTETQVEDCIPGGPLEGVLPLSFAQERLWFLEKLQPGSSQYSIPMAVRIEGPLRVEILRESLAILIERHAILRSVYHIQDGVPIQMIVPMHEISLPVQRVSSEMQALRVIQEEGLRPFDLERGPLFRAQLLHIHEECHIFFLAFHHSVADGWSLGILVRDLTESYEALMVGKRPTLPPLAIQYPDYAVWQRNMSQQGHLTAQLAYWRQQLSNVPVVDLPLDYSRPLLMSGRGATFSQVWDRTLIDQLRELSQREKATLFMLLLAAFQILLMRYSGQEDVVVGSPIANRTRIETEDLIGCFVNTLALRTDLADNPSFQKALERVRTTVLDAYERQDVPFEQVVKEIQLDRNLNRAPLVQVLFVLQNAPLPDLRISGLQWQAWPVETQTAKFDLTWQLEETANGLTCQVEYSTDLFAESTIEHMLAHYQQLLRSVVNDPTQSIWQLDLLLPAEQRNLLEIWGRAEAELPAVSYIHEFFERQVGRTPDRRALRCGERCLTYLELEQQANQLAHYLRRQGVGPDVTVGLCLERKPELLIAILAIFKAGGAYVPLDPNYPLDRLTYMLRDSRAQILLTQRSQVLTTEYIAACQTLVWEDFQVQLSSEPVTRPEYGGLHPEHIAYLIYTSGSTGLPKGSAIVHRSTVHFLAWARQTFTPAQLASTLAATSVCFDLSIFEMFAPLSVGGEVVLVENLLHLIDANFQAEITLINTVPSAIAELVRTRRLPEHVQVVNLAGEAYAPQLVADIYEQCPHCQLWNLYGPSETTTYSTGITIPVDAQCVTTIGRPVSNTEVYVLDHYGQLAPAGVIGELYIGGVGLARGYFQRPDLTAERFVPHPWSNVPGARLYRTGDLVRYDAAGQLHFLGRADAQVKVRGFRIELGEIEAVLRQMPEIQEAVVALREIRPGEEGLTAYVVEVLGQSVSDEVLREYLSRWLPGYMLPVVFVRLPALPLTPNGKVDKKSLPEPIFNRPTTDRVVVEPRTEFEKVLVEIWQNVLQIDRVGILDNFFELGGHSLLMIQVYSKIQERLADDVAIVDLFQYPTIQALARYLVGRSGQQAIQQTSVDRADRRKALMRHQQAFRRDHSAH